jgi:hypothetical protein
VRRVPVAILFLIAALVHLQAAPLVTAEIPFQYREGFLWVEVHIANSEKPFNFLLDTGAGVSVINLNAAQRLGLKLGREITVRGVGKTLTGHWQERIAVKAGDVQLPHEYLVVDLGKLSDSCERPVDGLIGMDFFRERVIQIDFERQKIRLLKPQKNETFANTLPLDMRPCGMCVPIMIDNHACQWVRLDTGCAKPLHWVTTDISAHQCTRQTAIGLAEISIPMTETTVALGNLQFRRVPTGLHGTPIFQGEAGLLGNGLLSRFSSITIDAKANRLILGDLRDRE